MTISEILSNIQSGKQTAEAVTRACLAKIAELNPTINALVEVWAEDALKQAQAVDAKKPAGKNWARWPVFPWLLKITFYIKAIKPLAVPKCWRIMWPRIMPPW